MEGDVRLRRRSFAVAAAIATVLAGFLWLAIQPGVPGMGDITGEDDGGLAQGLIVFALDVAATVYLLRSPGSFAAAKPFFLWNAIAVAVWLPYSAFHIERWREAGGSLLLLIPEALLVLHAAALVLGSLDVVLLQRRDRAVRS